MASLLEESLELVGGTLVPLARGKSLPKVGGCSSKELSFPASFSPGGDQGWVCVSGQKLKLLACRFQCPELSGAGG